MSDFSRLLEPARWGTLELPNRIFMPPMGTSTTDAHGLMTDRSIAYYTERARGGAGLLIIESLFTQTVSEMIPPHVASLATDDHIGPLRALVDSVHAVGGRIAGNLTPGTGRNIPTAPDGGPPWSASDNPLLGDPDQRCRVLSLEQIGQILEQYRAAVRRVLECGFDALDIHAHTGYLVDQFMSAEWNRRTDEYGGSLENRMRFATDLVRIARQEVGDDFPLSIRISMRHGHPGGREIPESQEMARILESAGIDVLLVDAGSYEAIDLAFPPYYRGDGVYLPDAEGAKAVVEIPVAVCGNLTPALGERALRDGIADFIGYGRMLIADPELPAKVREGRASAVRPCIRCNQMCLGGDPGVGCAVNPRAGRELEREIVPAQTPKRVTVVGAGPAGLEAARVAALRGHHVAVYDRAPVMGGVLEPAARPEFKRELHRTIGWWRGELDALGVPVHLGHEVTADSPEVTDADALVLATGSTPVLPDIPGLDGPNVVEVLDFHRGEPVGHRAVVCGGGISGADAALELAQAGHEVTIVEMADEIARDMVVYNRVALLRMLAEHGVQVLAGHVVTAVDADGVTAKGEAGEVHLPADTVIAAFGVRGNRALAEQLEDGTREIHVIGDCVQPAKVGEAVHAGWAAGAAI